LVRAKALVRNRRETRANEGSKLLRANGPNCEREAAALPDIQLKNEFKEVARQWRELAQGVFETLPLTRVGLSELRH
jgi:hypothetical protein